MSLDEGARPFLLRSPPRCDAASDLPLTSRTSHLSTFHLVTSTLSPVVRPRQAWTFSSCKELLPTLAPPQSLNWLLRLLTLSGSSPSMNPTTKGVMDLPSLLKMLPMHIYNIYNHCESRIVCT